MVPKAGIEPARAKLIGFWDRRVYQFHHFGKAECIIGFRFPMVKSYHNKKGLRNLRNPLKFGGAKRDRTADLLNAIQALSQLSYSP